MHKAQLSILYNLRHTRSVSFSDLMRPTGMTSDNFKFHIQKLVRLGYVAKQLDGTYCLTQSGKEYANNLSDFSRDLQKQPKLSVMLIVTRQSEDGMTQYLVQRRLRQPFFGYWGFLSGPIQWGELPETTGDHELAKQGALKATFTVAGHYRERNHSTDGQLLEDKLFTLLVASEPSGVLSNSWPGGHNQWTTLDQLEKLPNKFVDTVVALKMLSQGQKYFAKDTTYQDAEY